MDDLGVGEVDIEEMQGVTPLRRILLTGLCYSLEGRQPTDGEACKCCAGDQALRGARLGRDCPASAVYRQVTRRLTAGKGNPDEPSLPHQATFSPGQTPWQQRAGLSGSTGIHARHMLGRALDDFDQNLLIDIG
jgi:hypothetical protein